MEASTETDSPPPRRSIIATLKGLGFTLLILIVLWLALRYVLTPLVLGKQPQVEAPVSSLLEERVKALEAKVAHLEANPAAVPDTGMLEERVAMLEQRPAPEATAASSEDIASLRADIDRLKLESGARVQSIVLVSELRDAVRTGRPFDRELSALLALRPDMKESLAALANESSTGIATLTMLQEQFARAIHPALAAKDEDRTFVRNLRSLVKVRKVGEKQQGADDEAIIARAEAKLGKGDVAMAVAEIAALSAGAGAHLEAWRHRAESHLAAQRMLEQLQATLGGPAA